MRHWLACTFLSAGLVACAPPAAPLLLPRNATIDRDAAQLFAAHRVEGAFVLLHAPTQRLWVVNPEVAQQRFTPASTFKLPNALISLSEGVAPSADFTLRWDGTVHTFVKAWNRDHNLRTAMRHSVLWYFQELARRVGQTRMQRALEAMDYGDRNLSAGVDRFWLESLQISPYEQVRFVEKLWANTLPFPKAQQVRVRELLTEYERSSTHVWRGKTGTALRGRNSNRPILWLVGGVEAPDGPWLYAMLARTAREDLNRAMGSVRTALTRALLERGGALPQRR